MSQRHYRVRSCRVPCCPEYRCSRRSNQNYRDSEVHKRIECAYRERGLTQHLRQPVDSPDCHPVMCEYQFHSRPPDLREAAIMRLVARPTTRVGFIRRLGRSTVRGDLGHTVRILGRSRARPVQRPRDTRRLHWRHSRAGRAEFISWISRITRRTRSRSCWRRRFAEWRFVERSTTRASAAK